MENLELYIENSLPDIERGIRENPVFGEKVNIDFSIIGGDFTPPIIENLNACVDFLKKIINELREYRLDEEKTRGMLDCLFWCFPVKGDTTLDGWNCKRLYFVDLLRNKGLTDEEVIKRTNGLPACCASVIESILFEVVSFDESFIYASNHLRVCRNGRDGMRYNVWPVDREKLRNLVIREQKEVQFHQTVAFGLKYEYLKCRDMFGEKVYSLLCNGGVQFLDERTSAEDFRGVLFTRDCNRETKRIIWNCDSRDVYYLTKGLMNYINNLTFVDFGKLCISKCGKGLKNLKASRTDLPRHKQEIDAIFKDLNAWIENN